MIRRVDSFSDSHLGLVVARPRAARAAWIEAAAALKRASSAFRNGTPSVYVMNAITQMGAAFARIDEPRKIARISAVGSVSAPHSQARSTYILSPEY